MTTENNQNNIDPAARNAITEICSILQYLLDRGETEYIKDVEESVRYTNGKIDSFVLRSGRKRYRITIAPETAPRPKSPKIKGELDIPRGIKIEYNKIVDILDKLK